jgi:TIR domain
MYDLFDHIAAPAPLSNHGIESEGLIARAVDSVFTYDLFIPYRNADGMRLPRRIKERLEQADFSVFLDQTEYAAGDDLRQVTRRQIVKSRKILMIDRRGALKSEWVKREVDVALAHGEIPVIVNLSGARKLYRKMQRWRPWRGGPSGSAWFTFCLMIGVEDSLPNTQFCGRAGSG